MESNYGRENREDPTVADDLFGLSSAAVLITAGIALVYLFILEFIAPYVNNAFANGFFFTCSMLSIAYFSSMLARISFTDRDRRHGIATLSGIIGLLSSGLLAWSLPY